MKVHKRSNIAGSIATRYAGLVVCAALAGTGAIAQDHSPGAHAGCGPKQLLLDTDGKSLLVLCDKSGGVMRIDLETGRTLGETVVGGWPHAMCMDPGGTRLYVTCRAGQEVRELDLASLGILRRFQLRGDPTGVAVSGDGARLYVGLHSLDQVAVLNLEQGTVQKRLAAGNGPETIYRASSTDLVYVTNLLSNPVPSDKPCLNEVTVIDDRTAQVCDRVILEGANIGRGVSFASDGSIGIVAVSRPKNLLPMVQVARGWVVTNGFAVLSAESDTPPVQLLVDLPNRAFADPHGVAMTPDQQKFYLSCAGADAVIVVDVQRVRAVAADARRGAILRPEDHLGLSRRFVIARIPVGANPQALTVSEDGRAVYVANRLDDTISVIDTETDTVIRTIVLAQPSLERGRVVRGERLFHNASRTFHGQFSCASCHPDGGFDGLQYDLEPDGLGENLLDNRNLRGVAGTGPFKWIGSNPDITTQCGTRTAKWIVRTGWLGSMEVVDLAAYIRSIAPVVNPYRLPGGDLTPAQRRGKALFERTTLNDGTPIDRENRCDFCHSGPKFFDGRQFDVGTKGPRDSRAEFDTAHLVNIFESAPYLHDGRSATLEELWTLHNPDDRHGVSSDWTKRQLNDLTEYLKSL